MKKYLVLVAAVFMLSSCSNRPNDKGEYVIKPGNSTKELHVKYSADGNIEYIQEYKDGKPDGMLMNYHKQNPKNISFIEKDKNQGCGVVFHNNGNVNNFGQYVDGQKTGWFYVFNTDEIMTGKREYLNVEGKEFLNQWIEYASNGSIKQEESNYIKVAPAAEKIKQGEDFVMNVSLEAAYFKAYMIVVVGPFDANYALPANAKCDTVKAVNFVATYRTKTYNKGKNLLRGMVQDLRPDEKDPKKINVRKIYFSQEFKVE